MKQRERVAEMRRDLPQGAIVNDYEFEEGPRDLNAGDSPVSKVRLSELFSQPDRSLVIYHFMYGKKNSKACPMCTAWIDGVNGIAHHLAQKLDFALVAAADVPTLRGFARERGWDKLRLVSAGDSTFKFDFGSENPDGGQDSTISVFTRDANGAVRHFYTAHPWMSPEIKERGIDLLAPIWHFLDLPPQGRGDQAMFLFRFVIIIRVGQQPAAHLGRVLRPRLQRVTEEVGRRDGARPGVERRLAPIAVDGVDDGHHGDLRDIGEIGIPETEEPADDAVDLRPQPVVEGGGGRGVAALTPG